MSAGSGPTPPPPAAGRVVINVPPSRMQLSRWQLWRLRRGRKQVQSTEDLERAEIASRNVLRKGYGWGLLAILAVQIGYVDWVFFRYANDGRHWDVHASVMNAWLAATVVEVIGITTIVVRHLFPRQDKVVGPVTDSAPGE